MGDQGKGRDRGCSGVGGFGQGTREGWSRLVPRCQVSLVLLSLDLRDLVVGMQAEDGSYVCFRGTR